MQTLSPLSLATRNALQFVAIVTRRHNALLLEGVTEACPAQSGLLRSNHVFVGRLHFDASLAPRACFAWISSADG
jgi:hypothetical protein